MDNKGGPDESADSSSTSLRDLLAGADRLGRERDERKKRSTESHREARSLYADNDGNPILRPSFVVYLDELGAANRYRALTQEGLRSQVRDLDRYRWFLHDEEWEDDYQRILSFSDNVVIGSPILPQAPGGFGLGMLLGSVIGYQLNLTARGHFLRGAITAGQLFMDDRFVMGPALIEAVELEEHAAVFPRVVFDELCVLLVLEDLKSYGSAKASPWNEQLLVDADSRFFLNYLVGIAEDGIEGQVERGLSEHKRMIVQNLNQHEDDPIREKYVWAAQYHNFVHEEFFPDQCGDYSIDSELSTVERQVPRKFQRMASALKQT